MIKKYQGHPQGQTRFAMLPRPCFRSVQFQDGAPRDFSPRDSIARAFRAPKRITITVPFSTHEKLLMRSDEQGRSLSNLAAYLLELSLSAE